MTTDTDDQESNPAYDAVLEFEASAELVARIERSAQQQGITVQQLVRNAVSKKLLLP